MNLSYIKILFSLKNIRFMVVLDLCIDLFDSYKFRNEYKVDLNVMVCWILIILFENCVFFIGFFI